jgi:hypothetical protein
MRNSKRLFLTLLFISVISLLVVVSEYFTQPVQSTETAKGKNVVTTYRSIIKNNPYSQHIEVGKALSGKAFENIADVESTYKKRGLVKVNNSRGVIIDKLTHSKPYLNRHSASILEEIGREFYKQTGGGSIIITSLTRPIEHQNQLVRTNINASPNISSHSYGVSFDIAYTRFNKDKKYCHNSHKVIEELLIKMQSEKRILVIREKQSACYHITVNKLQ